MGIDHSNPYIHSTTVLCDSDQVTWTLTLTPDYSTWNYIGTCERNRVTLDCRVSSNVVSEVSSLFGMLKMSCVGPRKTASDCVSHNCDCEWYPGSEPDHRDERQRNWEWMFSGGTRVRWLLYMCAHAECMHAHAWPESHQDSPCMLLQSMSCTWMTIALHFLHICMCTCMICEPSRRTLHVEKIHESQDNSSCMQLRTCKQFVVYA